MDLETEVAAPEYGPARRRAGIPELVVVPTWMSKDTTRTIHAILKWAYEKDPTGLILILPT